MSEVETKSKIGTSHLGVQKNKQTSVCILIEVILTLKENFAFGGR